MTQARVLPLAAFAAVITIAGGARAQDRVELCASAAEDAQSIRAQGHLVEARKKLVVCADAACPAVVKDHCATWLAEVDKATPTLVVRVRDARGNDVSGARALVDGVEILASITGRAVALDPGPHTLRIVASSGVAREQAIVVAEGEKDRAIVMTLDAPLRPDGTRDGPASPSPLPVAPAPSSPSRITAPFVVTASIAVVGLGVFTGLEIVAQPEYSKEKNGCALTHMCSPTEDNATRSKFVGAGIALGVGAAALVVATVIFATHSSSPSSSAARASSLFAASPAAPPSLGLARF